MQTDSTSRAESFDGRRTRFLTALSFFLGFLDAFYLYVISFYFVSVTGSDNVGGFYLIAFSLVFLILVTLGTVVGRFGAVRLLLTLLLALVGSAAWLVITDVSWWGAVLLLFFLVVNNVFWVVMDILLEDASTDRLSGRVRGLYLTVMNAGLLSAPFLATTVLDRFGYSGVFAGLAVGYALVFGAALIGLTPRVTSKRSLSSFNLAASWGRLRARPNVFRIYHVSFALEFFYVIMIIYTPIYLLTVLNFRWEDLGIIFTFMLIPFVLLQYPLGRLADRHFGEKEFLIGGLILLALTTALVSFADSPSLFVWGAILFLTRIGAASLEILRDSYFYKQVDATNTDLIAFFRTARPVANIVGALLSLAFLFFFSLQWIFLLVTFAALLALCSALRLRDTVSERDTAPVTPRSV